MVNRFTMDIYGSVARVQVRVSSIVLIKHDPIAIVVIIIIDNIIQKWALSWNLLKSSLLKIFIENSERARVRRECSSSRKQIRDKYFKLMAVILPNAFRFRE